MYPLVQKSLVVWTLPGKGGGRLVSWWLLALADSPSLVHLATHEGQEWLVVSGAAPPRQPSAKLGVSGTCCLNLPSLHAMDCGGR